jgi:tetratricopeptide (TPR) repeat protein
MEKAVFWWGKILDQEPENQALWTRVADALVSLGKLDEAEVHYQASLKVGYDLFAVLGLARVAQKQQNYDKAQHYCEQALEHDGDNARALEELALICDDAGFREKAKKLRERIES